MNNPVGSLPLAKNALHSPPSDIHCSLTHLTRIPGPVKRHRQRESSERLPYFPHFYCVRHTFALLTPYAILMERFPPPGSKFKHTRAPACPDPTPKRERSRETSHLFVREHVRVWERDYPPGLPPNLPLLVGSVVRVFIERGREGV